MTDRLKEKITIFLFVSFVGLGLPYLLYTAATYKRDGDFCHSCGRFLYPFERDSIVIYRVNGNLVCCDTCARKERAKVEEGKP